MSRFTPFVVGLTGGIASGKTTVTDTFASLDVPILDTDLIARELVAPHQPVLLEIARVWPDCVADGVLNRAKLRERVFNDKTARQTLEAWLHPRIFQTVTTRLQTLSTPYAVVAVPLLAESGRQAFYDRIAVVDVEESLQINRLRARDGTSEALAQAILAAQATRSERLQIADDVIDNGSDLAYLKWQVVTLDQHYRRLAVNANAAA